MSAFRRRPPAPSRWLALFEPLRRRVTLNDQERGSSSFTPLDRGSDAVAVIAPLSNRDARHDQPDHTVVPLASPELRGRRDGHLRPHRSSRAVACPAECTSSGLATLKVSLELVAKHLNCALEEQKSSGSHSSFALLRASLPVLFAAEARAFAPAGVLTDADLGRRVAERFPALACAPDVGMVWMTLTERAAARQRRERTARDRVALQKPGDMHPPLGVQS
jgi:hypothetical protein